MNENILKEYARFLVTTALNVQKHHTLIINCPVENTAFAHMCAKAAYKHGVKEVLVNYNDETLARLSAENVAVEVLEDVKPWYLARMMEYVDGGASVLNLIARNPELYKGIDTEKLSRQLKAQSKLMRPWQEVTMSNKVQWCVAAISGRAWAQKVFPNVPAEAAEEKLWQAILFASRASEGKPALEWEKHAANLAKHAKMLTKLDLDSVHLTSANGTNLVLGLPKNHMWAAAAEPSASGVMFLPNIPTEEVFTSPDRMRVNGRVKASMPYVYNGNVIEGIDVTFKDGLAVEYSSASNNELFKKLLETDDGARRLGEIAFVPASSPIRKTGLLFYNTLFDENAACHMAFGAAYPSTVKGSESCKNEQELANIGLNSSLIHEDVMIGTEDMRIVGKKKSGEEVEIFCKGEWAI